MADVKYTKGMEHLADGDIDLSADSDIDEVGIWKIFARATDTGVYQWTTEIGSFTVRSAFS